MNPDLSTIYKRTELKQVQSWNITVEGDHYFTTEGILGGKATISKPTFCKGKNIGRSNETSPEQQAFFEADAKRTKKLKLGYSDSPDKIDDEASFFHPMLCKNYDNLKEPLDFGEMIFSQPKLDGMRCIAKADGLWSRGGERIVSAPHIEKALERRLHFNKDYIFDGELYCHKLHADFPKLMSLARKTKPTTQDLKESEAFLEYWVYDSPSINDNFSERNLAILHTLISTSLPIRIVSTTRVKSQEHLDQLYHEYMSDGYEGQIIRFDSPYKNGRTNAILKRKQFQTDEFTVLDICEGEGNKAGMAGFAILKLKDGRSFSSNLKYGHEDLKKILVNRKMFIGKTATCQFFQLSPDGIPRFPYVIDFSREIFEGKV